MGIIKFVSEMFRSTKRETPTAAGTAELEAQQPSSSGSDTNAPNSASNLTRRTNFVNYMIEKGRNTMPPIPGSNTIDWKFILEREGFETKGYVPAPDTSSSGVTIASGVDLGQRSAAEIKMWPISEDLKKRLLPYVGLKKYEAVAACKAVPLVVTKEEAAQLNSIVKQQSVNVLRNQYNTSITPDKLKFDNLPTEAQTVITSVAFQYGSLQSRCVKFWRAVTNQDWAATVSELRNFGDAYGPRRNLEADYLMPLVKRSA
jgi:GH24 family phage-related lysozyme (muramidase)